MNKLYKYGYKQRYEDNGIIIFDLKKELQDGTLPETIIINKSTKRVSFSIENVEKYIFLGTMEIDIDKEILEILNEKIKQY